LVEQQPFKLTVEGSSPSGGTKKHLHIVGVCFHCYGVGMKYSVLLHNIRSIHNVGSIFRTADAAGFDHVYLSGYTPLPVDRFGRERSDMNKVALGAEQSLPWSQLSDIQQDLKELKESGSYLVAVEQDKGSVSYDSLKLPEVKEVILMMGEEVSGIEQEILNLCDAIVEIPMRGEKESLNVSVAFGIAAYELKKAKE
jgi:23S rRNA (guanosine2251-2'-O)-methyltransferase